ncbi:alpha/beta fold hydrolase [Patulibacter sp. SYSU D01012]|uniref:alpha/beta fold hydrolase n=1 Tax=Patulibacter sp. SYSU D01012 TaxID=2817381 RepID=UPI001B3072C6|nr:alpha/beta fold hydrolase [Patulibacter sp. SYSU D01012]
MQEHVAVPGARLWTATSGRGVPLVLCHGGPGLSDNLGPLAGLLDDVALVHRYDQRGGGRSSAAGPFDVATFVADLEALRTHWGHERWIVGGHSWGAVLALLYALEHPDRVLGVVSVSGTGVRWGWQAATRTHRLERLTAAERQELQALEAALGTGDPAARARVLRLMWTTDFADRATADAVLDAGPLYAFPRADAVFRAVSADQRRILDAGLEERIRALPAPLLAVHGAADSDPARAERLAALAPRGRFVLLPGCGHSPWLERPDAVAAALRPFVAGRAADA